LQEPLAIVGMSCRLPGADGLDAFWRLVESGGVAWGPLPESRLPRDLYFDPRKGQLGRSYSEMGALVSERQPDPRTCPITEEMRHRYDIAHVVFLEVTAQACRDAGLDPFAMPADRRTGVYVGHTGGSTRIGDIVYGTGIDETATLLGDVDVARRLLGPDVAAVAAEVTAAIRDRYPGRLPGERLDLEALGAARIVQEALRLDGPYLVVDAACASSLQALAIAARSLATGGIDQAIVGGASYCKSDSLVLFSAAQSVSNTGSCPFGSDADGLVTAEGYVALVLKTLSRAQADGDRIRAVIRGIGVASDGKGKSLWAPRREGQMLAVERAYPDPAEMSHIDYIEAHATSTQVGDATELGALASLLGKHLPAGRRIPIGSVKANIGHTLETAGLASLVKVVLAMEHGVIPPGSTCRELNEEFCWDEGPFSVPRESLPWPRRADGGPRCAAVNAFGIGGLNVHLALAESAPARAPSVVRPTPAGDDGAIAIVGIGCVLPGALSVAAFGELLDRGVPALADVPADRWNLRRALDPSGPRPWRTVAGRGGFVIGFQYDWRRHKVPPKQIAAANPLQFMLLEAADAAIADLGGPARLDRARTAVVVGTMFGGEFSNDLQMGLRLPETAVHLRAALQRRGLGAGEIEAIVAAYEKKVLEELPALVDETGSFTSSTLASRLTKSFDLMGGALALDAGDCSTLAAIAAAADMLHQGTCDAVVCAAGQRAMDLMAFEGLSLEGALTAEPAAPFNAAGGRIPAEGAVVLVLKSLAAARAAGDPIRAVIRGVRVGSGVALEEVAPRVVHDAATAARVPPTAIGAVEVSGSGAAAIDGVVAAALAAEYGNAGGPPRSAGSLDGLVGHCGAGAGAAAVVKLARSLASGTLPATPGIAGEVTVAPGIVASAAPRAIPAADAAGYRAATVTTVHALLVGHLVIDNGLPVPTAATVVPAAPAAQARPIAPPAAGGRALVAAIFPGQGSQYGDMFRSLATETADGSAVRDELDGMARRVGLPTLAETAWRADHVLGLDILATQWSMYLGDLCAWRVLERLGFAPDIVASHSFGEFPALAAVGAWSVDDGARATRARADAVLQHGPRGGAMLSVIADRATVGDLIAPLAGSVWVCAENAPEQIVVGGTVAGIDALEARLQPTRIRSKRLAVPSPFHTPLLAAAADRLAGALAPVAFATPRLPLVSSTTVEPLVDAAAIRASLVRQMTERVRWVDVVRRLHAAGVRTFVEVGPSGVLTGLVRRILDGLPGVTLVQFDQRGQAGADHLRRLRDQLSAAGALRTVATAVAVPSAVRAVATHPAILSFDATARRRARNRAGGGGPPAVPAGTAPAPTAPIAMLANGHAADAPGSPRAPSPAPSGRHGGDSGTARNGSHDGGNGAAAAPLAPAPYVAVGSAATNGSAYPSSGNGYHAGGSVIDASAKAAPVRLRNAAAGASPVIRPVGGLEQIVVALLTEHAARLPLASAGTAGSDVLDALEHLFESVPSRRAAVMAATTLDDFCALLAASGGKAEWVEPAPPVSARAGAAKPSAQGDGLETFVIDFVVEQTGYPREIVELDADLEGDLGIDSIRKAQLFGEIGQRYGLGADASVSLDDFRTLRHLLDYMLPRVGGAGTSTAAVAAVAPAPAPVASAPAVVASAAAAPASAAGAAELEAFVVDFVVEQTGYPREIVELDADLEGDLGIDSIRKAQLFGEIGQRYGLGADASVSLDDFRTLRHLLDYMLPRVGGAGTSTAAVAAVAPAPAPVASAPAVVASAAAAPASAAGAAELEAFVVDFVVEQTGYPREIVELDADLEGDLGIDSIRKAQLFGEIGQRYGLGVDASVSLDDFRTLRHLLDYMLPRVGGHSDATPASVVAASASFVAPPARAPSEAFVVGQAEGRRHSAAIRGWCRELAALGSAAQRATPDQTTADFLAGVADATGIDRGILEAGWAEPARALGGLDVIADLAGRDGPAILVGFGRHAAPVIRQQSVGTTLVGVAGLPGAVAGWNDAGIVALVSPAAAPGAAQSIERIVTTVQAHADVAASGPWPAGIVIALAGSGTVFTTDGSGRPVGSAPAFRAVRGDAPLGRILCSAAPDTPLTALLASDPAGLPAALSAAATWMIAGVDGSGPRALSGGPLSAGDLAAAAASLAAVLATRSPRPSPTTPSVPCDEGAITRRYGLAIRPLPAAPAARLAGERVLVLAVAQASDDGVAAVADRLRREGAAVEIGRADDAATAVMVVERAESAGPVRHLLMLTPSGEGRPWSAAAGEPIASLFSACQRWIVARNASGDLGRSTLTAATTLGGDFGLAGDIGWVGGGALTGLFKNIAHECAGLVVRVVDLPAAITAAERADRIAAEIGAAGPVEVGYASGQRVEIVPTEGGPRPGRALASLAPGSVWLVTGGARGVTAACALEVARRRGVDLVLVGSTNPEPVEPAWLDADAALLRDLKGRVMLAAKGRGEDPRRAWARVEKSIEIARSLARFRAAGVKARYHACDLADAAAVGRLVADVAATVGPIRGILHGAGWESACRFEKKTLAGLAATLGPKCLGLEALLAAASGQPVEALVAFGSTSGRFGGHGQADYSLANDLLAKLVADARRRLGLRATTFHWHAWDEVGMASRPESRFVLEQFGLEFMPLAEGVGRFLAELEAGLPDAEVLVTEPKLCPSGVATATDRRPGAFPERAETTRRGSLVQDVENTPDQSCVSFQLDPSVDRFLLDHRFNGRPLLPAVMGAELLCQAVIAAEAGASVGEIHDFKVMRPVGFPDDVSREIVVEVPTRSSRALSARALARATAGKGIPSSGTVECLSARCVVGPAEPLSARPEPSPMPFYPTTYREDTPLWHGPAFRTLGGLFLDRSGGWARLTAFDPDVTAAPRGARGWTVPVALVDGCVMACGVYSYVMCGQRIELPVGWDRARFVEAPRSGEKCTARLRFVSQTPGQSVYDVVAFGDDDRPLFSIEGLMLALASRAVGAAS